MANPDGGNGAGGSARKAGGADSPSVAKRPGPGRKDDALKSSVSIHDVASAASVSIATVSRVMNNPGLVSESTAKRVLDVIKKLGYVPNALAQGLSSRATHVLGIALPDIHGEFYSELMRGADHEARKRRYRLLISSEGYGNGDGPREGAGLGFGLIDGLAVMISEPGAARLKDASVPVVVIDADLTAQGLDSIVVDNAVGTRQAVEHLCAATSPAACFHAGGPKDNFDARERADAFAQALAARGHDVAPRQVRFGEYTSEWGKAWGKSLADAGLLRGAAVLAGNDEIAVGIYEAVEDAGLRVGTDVRIVGFDDTRLASLIRPKLSSVHIPMIDVGSAAVELLVRRIAEPDAPVQVRHIPTSLVVRDSSGGPTAVGAATR